MGSLKRTAHPFHQLDCHSLLLSRTAIISISPSQSLFFFLIAAVGEEEEEEENEIELFNFSPTTRCE